jgi:hypothetical protein
LVLQDWCLELQLQAIHRPRAMRLLRAIRLECLARHSAAPGLFAAVHFVPPPEHDVRYC